MTLALQWPGGRIEYPELDPPYILQAGNAACASLIEELARDGVPHTRHAVMAWADADLPAERARRNELVARATRFLDGALLRDHEERYGTLYAEYLNRQAAPRAAAFSIAVLRRSEPDAAWSSLPSALVAGWLGSRLAAFAVDV